MVVMKGGRNCEDLRHEGKLLMYVNGTLCPQLPTTELHVVTGGQIPLPKGISVIELAIH
jgi:hypothetical protein